MVKCSVAAQSYEQYLVVLGWLVLAIHVLVLFIYSYSYSFILYLESIASSFCIYIALFKKYDSLLLYIIAAFK